MRKSAVFALLLLLVVGIVAIVLFRSSDLEQSESIASAASSTMGNANGVNRDDITNNNAPSSRPVINPDAVIVGRKPYDTGIANDQRVQTTGDGKHVVIEAVQIARALHSPESSAEDDLDYIEQILEIYRLSFEQNPVAGDNQMVTQALLGDNPRDLVVFPADHPAISSKGELLDRWGNPYFFHALSGREMEIFSAGPDGELNTADDVQRSARDGQPLTGAEPDTELDDTL